MSSQRRIPPFLRGSSGPASAAARSSDTRRVPPFVITGGRAGGSDLSLHAQVVSLRLADAAAGHEEQAILRLCTSPQSVAEVSARLHLHLEVTRILISDLREAGLVNIYGNEIEDPSNDMAFLQKVLNGLRALT